MDGYEIDFLPVGSGEKSGDAIALRFWNSMNPAQGSKIFVIDGGTKDSGEALVAHINSLYGTNHVDAVILTHPDMDHASGLSVVLENMEVGALIMHQPWDHVEAIKHLFDNQHLTVFGVSRRIKAELQIAHDLKKIADQKNIPIFEPFQGKGGWDGLVHVLGPSQEFYREMLCQFECTPETLIEPKPAFLPGLFGRAASAPVEWIDESWDIETLQDGSDKFRPENSSSAIILFTVGDDRFLFTGDADEKALHLAADYASSNGIDLSALTLLHVPHHGSKHNVGPSVLNRIKAKKAQISAGPSAPKHPSLAVVNALIRRETAVFTTRGVPICHFSNNAPLREWGAATPLEFSLKVQK